MAARHITTILCTFQRIQSTPTKLGHKKESGEKRTQCVPILNALEGVESGEHQPQLNLMLSIHENVHLKACNPTPAEAMRKGMRNK